MKQIFALVLTMVIVFATLTSCTNLHDSSNDDSGQTAKVPVSEENGDSGMELPTINYGENAVNVFSQYLDEINFVSNLSQTDFISKVKQYSYNGASVLDVVIPVHYDKESGGGWMATGKLFGFYNDYSVTDDKKYANYFNRISTEVELDGLKLPHEIKFGDSLESIFEKLDIDLNPYNDFVLDKNSDTDMTLYNIGSSNLILQDLTLSKELVDYEMPCVMVYIEKYDIEQKDGKVITVERTVKFGFEADVLRKFEIKVNEMRAR